MRILMVTDGFPYPLTSGYLRHYNFITALARNHEITLFSAVDSTFKEDYRQAMAPYTARTLTFLSKSTKSKSVSRRLVKAVRTLLGRNQVISDMRSALERLLAEERFDVLLLAGEYTYHVVSGLETPPIISDMCDAYSERTRGRMKHARKLALPALWVKYLDLKRIEQRVIARAQRVLFASERDAAVVPASQQAKGLIVPNGVDTGYWRRSSPQLGQHCLIFTGAMHYPPNNDTALYLLREILPLVRQSIPDVRVLIVGHSPSPALLAAGAQSGVTVTGLVDDMRPYLEQATVFAAPMRFGSGIQNKVLEALAMELPVVTTPVVEAGLCLPDGERPPLVIADSPQALAEALVRELTMHSETRVPQAANRAFVERHFVWSRSVERLETVLGEVPVATEIMHN